MLRKTTSNQVQRIFHTFFDKYPSPVFLARARRSDIENSVRPLGLEYRRADLLKKLAQNLVEKHDGKVPSVDEKLRALPGVGHYTANAVLCLAYGKDLPLLDTNFIRILQRVFGIRSLKARARMDESFWRLACKLIPEDKGRELNFAVLDFGALVCRARHPKHEGCPLSDFCLCYLDLKQEHHEN
jgi:A/G-specific adenine glycosylase